MLLDADAIMRAAEYVDDTMFYREGHRRLFRAMIARTAGGDVVDPLTLADELARRGELEVSGGRERGWYHSGRSGPAARVAARCRCCARSWSGARDARDDRVPLRSDREHLDRDVADRPVGGEKIGIAGVNRVARERA